MLNKFTHAGQNETDIKGKKPLANPNDIKNEDEMTEEAKMAIAETFYMGGASSPRSLGPSVSTEGFMLIRNIFRKIFKRSKNSDVPAGK